MGLDQYLYGTKRLSGTDFTTIESLFTDRIARKEEELKVGPGERLQQQIEWLKRDMLSFHEEGESEDEGLYVGGWRHSDTEETTIYRTILDLAGASNYHCDGSPHLLLNTVSASEKELELRLCIGYWRKANQVHGWFVDKVQDGVDECQLSPVTREQFQELDSACALALKKRTKTAAMATIPPTEGFFFGGYDVDEYYWQDLRETQEQIAKALSLPDEWSFAYRSSW